MPESRAGKAVPGACVLTGVQLGAFIIGNISGGRPSAGGFGQGELAGSGGVVFGMSPFWVAVLIALFLV